MVYALHTEDKCVVSLWLAQTGTIPMHGTDTAFWRVFWIARMPVRRCRGDRGMGCCCRSLPLLLVLLCLGTCCRAQVHNLSLAVDEGLPPGTLVGDIRAGLPEGSPGVGFFLSEEDGESPVLRDFHIDTETGIVRTLRILDRERRQRYSFVAATLLGDVVQVEIKVQDVNDHSPTFPVESLRLQVSELTPPGTTFRLPAARDLDTGEYGLRGYTLIRGSQGSAFTLRYGESRSSLGAGKEVAVLEQAEKNAGVQDQKADRHRPAAQEWQEHDKFGQDNVYVHVDVSDFINETSEGLQAELKGTLVAIKSYSELGMMGQSEKSSAEGPEHKDAEHEYAESMSIVTDTNEDHHEYTSVSHGPNAQEGYLYDWSAGENSDRSDSHEKLQSYSNFHPLDLVLVHWLDREELDRYQLEVEAFDGGYPRRTGRLLVDITVLDANDNPPTFDHPEYKGWAWENAPVGTPICTVHATDPDLGSNGEVKYTLRSDEGYFFVEESSGIVKVNRPLDREQKAFHQLVVQAKDGGSQPEVSSVLVLIKVLDVNDNKPQIQITLLTDSGHPEISEGARVGEYLARISVSDPDLELQDDSLETKGQDRGEQEYSTLYSDALENSDGIRQSLLNTTPNTIKEQRKLYGNIMGVQQNVDFGHIGAPQQVSLSLEGSEGTFSLRSVAPQIYFLCVEAPLDREQKDLYELKLLAQDSGSPPLHTLKTLLVAVTDLNDEAPVFTHPEGYQVTVSEAASAGTAVLTLNAQDLDDNGPNSRITYILQDSVMSSAFMLDPLTGVLSINKTLDFETETALNLFVVATDHGSPPLSATCPVTIVIEDVNDNEPVFLQQFYNVTLQEHSAIGLCFLQVKATDADSGSFGDVQYSLSDRLHNTKESKKFWIDHDFGRICVSQDIDREGEPGSYDLIVKAEDGGGLSAQAFVRVDIEDINDNAPVFDHTSYVTSISSHTQPGTEILNVLATDRDGGMFGEVIYELVPGDKTPMFTIDSSTGIIYLIGALNHLEDLQVTFSVCARDRGGLTSAVNASITVNIQKTTVAPPIFEKSRYMFVISEDVPNGSAVGTVKAREPLNSIDPVSYRILSGDPHQMFSINSQFGIITTNKQLDHESQAIIVLTVQSQLGGAPVFSSTQVNITVTDINDNPPVFLKVNDRINLPQTTPPGSALYIAKAEDIDDGYNGLITYSIINEKQDMFTIEPNLGILYLNTTLTMICEHILLIMAEDSGHPPLSSLLTLTISVLKNNLGHALTFGNLVHQVEVSEDFTINSGIIQVKAYHGGTQSQQPRIIYSLLPVDSVTFGIDRNTGWIFLRQSLDYERTITYSLIVGARSVDQSEEQTATTSVIVNILDVNDNFPIFNHHNYFFTVPESSSPHGVVGTIRAKDMDSGRNGHLSYFLLSEENYFQINSKTGEVIHSEALDREQKAYHHLTVLVTDHGTPRCNATAALYITVTDLNDNKPFFPQLSSGKQLHVKVPDGQPGHMFVTAVYAKDPDAANNGTVVYSMSSDDGLNHFFINISSGEIWTTQTLSASLRSHYQLTVTASDRGVPPLEDFAIVNIQVISTSTGKSKDIIEVKTIKVPENVKPAEMIGSVKLHEDRVLVNSKLRYRLSDEDRSSHIAVDSFSGALYLSTPVDYEIITQYMLRVSIQDPNKIPPQNHSIILKVDVQDQNDHYPVFPDIIVVIGIVENVSIGTILYTFKAKDGDGNLANSKIKYSLNSEGGKKIPFVIHEWDGILTTTRALDRETEESFILTVIATDQATNITKRRRCSLTARIIIQDINDNHPSFLSPPAASVIEDAEIGSLIHRVVVEDPDEGKNGKITFHIMDGNSKQVFSLDETTGWLSLSSTVDREIQEHYTLTILATDNGNPALSATQNVTVTVTDVNDVLPTFRQALYETAIPENLEPGQHVMKVEAEDTDSGVNAALMYHILPGPAHAFFRINPDTGDLITAATLDREKQEEFIIKVMVTDGGSPSFSSSATIVCTVLDENDNGPELLFPETEIQVPENQDLGIIHKVLAIDKDAGNNGRVQFQIIGGNTGGYFAINNTSGELWTTRTLDRENVSSFTIIVECHDLGSPKRSTTAKLHIKVLDVNDNPPTFSKSQYRSSVSENLAAGSMVLSLHAADVDEGLNGEITYSMIDDTQGAFIINSTTGNIVTAKALDREAKHQYVFRVVASDSSIYGPLSSTVKVLIHIEDINDNPPSFLEDPVQVLVSYKSLVNTTIATVHASDPDQGLNGSVVYSLVESDPLFIVTQDTGEIKLQNPISHTFRNTILKVRASDLGVPVKTSTALVTIDLVGQEKDFNFVQNVYEANVMENSKAGTAVVTVEAKHFKHSAQSVSYKIISGEKDTFMLNSKTGELTVHDPSLLDFEARSRMNVIISAESRLSVTYTRVSAEIQDQNDNPPVFARDHHITWALEGQAYNMAVIQVFASDPDSGPNGQIDYTIMDGNENKEFTIDSRRGIISTNAILDREIKSSYRLVLQASDRGSPSLSSTSTVTVFVIDINDNAPTIPPLETVFLPEDTAPGFNVVCISANDVDLRPNVTYSFTEDGNPGMKFTIDKYSGVVTLIDVLDYEEASQYYLSIQASDSLYLADAELFIVILDVNDNPPLFTKDSYKASIPELTAPDTYILTVSATDRDSEMYGPVSYRIISPLKGFSINPTTGSVHTDVPVGIKDESTVIPILIEAKDNGSPSLTSTTILELQIHDVNNHAPSFSQKVYRINVSEDAVVGEAILTFTAEDLDWTHENAYTDFSIVSGNSCNQFNVQSIGTLSQPPFVVIGKLILNGNLDYETNTTHTLILQASDRGFSPLSSTATVMISVLDTNDNPPMFQNLEYHISVKEHHALNMEMISVPAIDHDSDDNAEIVYSIVSGNDEDIFTVDSQNGTVMLAKPLDYESVMNFALVLKATNAWRTKHDEAFTKLYITVLDDNDFPPQFLFSSLSCILSENMPPFSPVCTVNAIDLDSGPFGALSYSIQSMCLNEPKQETFFIDSLTGDIYTKHKIDYETQKKYCLVIQVKDRSESTACVLVYIDIEGEDEFPPIFQENEYLFDLPQENKPGQVIGKVVASDKDEGLDGVIYYNLEKPSQFFSVNSTSGVIFLTRSVHKIRSNTRINDDIAELVVRAQSPKLDSKSSTCTVRVNISTALEGYPVMSANILSISFSISFVVFLLLAISIIGIILRFKKKDVENACGIKEVGIPALPNTNVKDCMPDECPKYENIKSNIVPDTAEWLGLVGIREKKDTGNKCRNSDSSGHGSTEGETAEDEEIKMINEYPIRKESGSVLSERASRVPDSGIPRDSDLLSCESDETDVAIGSESTENVVILKEENGDGECHAYYSCKKDLPTTQHNSENNTKDKNSLPETSQDYIYVPMSYDSRYGSLASLVASDEDLRGSYNWDYLLSWEPRFQTLSSVFCDIGRLKDEKMHRHVPKQKKPFIFPPPLITSVAQPGIRAVPPRMPTIMSGQTYVKYPRSPFFSNLACQPSTMTPTFSPSLSMLTVHTPSTSPIRSDTRINGTSVPALSEELLIQEFQV
ncbi:protocadherin-23 [Anomaloglossus baeobatrachus]|uniref:protocadherin-23 n=1 Tax=Anomaloglossus baeobatrachus TaxID=238106 RepID=UPI003F4F697B